MGFTGRALLCRLSKSGRSPLALWPLLPHLPIRKNLLVPSVVSSSPLRQSTLQSRSEASIDAEAKQT
jgi:hypothetical protein